MALATIGAPLTFTVRAARHAKKKATKGHRDTRPKKTSPSQRRRTPTEYPTVDPASVPAVMTVVIQTTALRELSGQMADKLQEAADEEAQVTESPLRVDDAGED